MSGPSMVPSAAMAAAAPVGHGATELDAAVTMVAALMRLSRVCVQQPDDSSHVIVKLAETAAAAVFAYCNMAELAAADFMISNDVLFVNGVALRGLPDASDLIGLFRTWGFTRLVVQAGVTAENVRRLVRMISGPERIPEVAEMVHDGLLANLRAPRAPESPTAPETPVKRALRTYSVAVVTTREALAQARPEVPMPDPGLPRRMKRVAQAIVTQVTDGARGMVTIATLAPLHEPATYAVATAILATAMLAPVTTDRALLASVTLAGLAADAGYARLAKGASALDEAALDRIPASAGLAATLLFKAGPRARPRVALAFEAHWLRRADRLGAPYRGQRAPALAARALVIARDFVEMRAAAVKNPESIEVTLARMGAMASHDADRACVRMLTGALGLFPTGTTVRLNTGEMGVVLETPDHPLLFTRPRVRIACDAAGNVLDTPFDRDLRDPDGGIVRWIQSAIAPNTMLGQAMQEAARAYDAQRVDISERASMMPLSLRDTGMAISPGSHATPVQNVAVTPDAVRGHSSKPAASQKPHVSHRPTPLALPAVSVMLEAMGDAADDGVAMTLASFPEENAIAPFGRGDLVSAREVRESRAPRSRRDPREETESAPEVVSIAPQLVPIAVVPIVAVPIAAIRTIAVSGANVRAAAPVVEPAPELEPLDMSLEEVPMLEPLDMALDAPGAPGELLDMALDAPVLEPMEMDLDAPVLEPLDLAAADPPEEPKNMDAMLAAFIKSDG